MEEVTTGRARRRYQGAGWCSWSALLVKLGWDSRGMQEGHEPFLKAESCSMNSAWLTLASESRVRLMLVSGPCRKEV